MGTGPLSLLFAILRSDQPPNIIIAEKSASQVGSADGPPPVTGLPGPAVPPPDWLLGGPAGPPPPAEGAGSVVITISLVGAGGSGVGGAPLSVGGTMSVGGRIGVGLAASVGVNVAFDGIGTAPVAWAPGGMGAAPVGWAPGKSFAPAVLTGGGGAVSPPLVALPAVAVGVGRTGADEEPVAGACCGALSGGTATATGASWLPWLEGGLCVCDWPWVGVAFFTGCPLEEC